MIFDDRKRVTFVSFIVLDFTKQVSTKGKTMSETALQGQQCFPGSKGMATAPLAGDVLVYLNFTLYDARKSEFHRVQ